ncbi:MAG: winged helix-turn-helix transcriptional regulator [Candidatus Pacearchaeota archaeon]
MDEKDKLILFELLQDCRQPTSKIARAVRLPQQTVSYRIKKFEDSKVIKKYTADINYPKLGYSRHSLYLDVKGVSASEVDKYLKAITDIKEVSCCYMLHEVSQWKLYVSVWTKTLERYDEIQTKITSKFKKKIKNYISFQSVKSFTYFAKRLNPNKKSLIDVKGSSENVEISDADWKLIEKLKKNSKVSAMDLANHFRTNASSITRRINSLKKKEIIERFYPILDVKKLGYTEYTFITRIDPSYNKELEQFIEFTKKDPRFVIMIKAVGYVNLYYAFLIEDKKELSGITEKIHKILGKAVLEEYKIEVDEMIS